MEITLDPQLQTAIIEQARREGVTPENLAINALRERFLTPARPLEPQDEWERLLLQAASDCGVSLPNEALSSEGLYE